MEEVKAGIADAAQEEVVSNQDTQPDEVQQQEETKEKEPEKTGNPKVDDPWPKSARNAISRRDKQLGAMRAHNQEMQKRLEALEAAQKQSSQPKAPSGDDPEWQDKPYEEYLIAKATHALRQEQVGKQNADPKTIREQALQEAQQQLHYQQRIASMEERADKYMQEIPEYAALVEEYSDVIDQAPQHIVHAFLDADDGSMAFYALAKEGRLEQLATMTPMRAAQEIAKAQIRGEQMFKASRVTKAPAPIQGAKGTSPTSSELNMSGKDLLKKYGLT